MFDLTDPNEKPWSANLPHSWPIHCQPTTGGSMSICSPLVQSVSGQILEVFTSSVPRPSACQVAARTPKPTSPDPVAKPWKTNGWPSKTDYAALQRLNWVCVKIYGYLARPRRPPNSTRKKKTSQSTHWLGVIDPNKTLHQILHPKKIRPWPIARSASDPKCDPTFARPAASRSAEGRNVKRTPGHQNDTPNGRRRLTSTFLLARSSSWQHA